MRCWSASGVTVTGWSSCAALAANCATEVCALLQRPKVTNASKSLPVILEARWTNFVRRALASICSVEKNSVTFSTMLIQASAIAVSFPALGDANLLPSYHTGETATSPTFSRG
jgi:hypothetical protein